MSKVAKNSSQSLKRKIQEDSNFLGDILNQCTTFKKVKSSKKPSSTSVGHAKNNADKTRTMIFDSHSKPSSTKEKEHSLNSKPIQSESHTKSSSIKDRERSQKSTSSTSQSHLKLFEIEDNAHFQKSSSKTYESKSSRTKDIEKSQKSSSITSELPSKSSVVKDKDRSRKSSSKASESHSNLFEIEDEKLSQRVSSTTPESYSKSSSNKDKKSSRKSSSTKPVSQFKEESTKSSSKVYDSDSKSSKNKDRKRPLECSSTISEPNTMFIDIEEKESNQKSKSHESDSRTSRTNNKEHCQKSTAVVFKSGTECKQHSQSLDKQELRSCHRSSSRSRSLSKEKIKNNYRGSDQKRDLESFKRSLKSIDHISNSSNEQVKSRPSSDSNNRNEKRRRSSIDSNSKGGEKLVSKRDTASEKEDARVYTKYNTQELVSCEFNNISRIVKPPKKIRRSLTEEDNFKVPNKSVANSKDCSSKGSNDNLHCDRSKEQKVKIDEVSKKYEKLKMEEALMLLYKSKKSPNYSSTDSGKGSTRSNTPNYLSEDLEAKTVDSSVFSLQDKTACSNGIEPQVTPIKLKLNTPKIKTMINSSKENEPTITNQSSINKRDDESYNEYKKHISKSFASLLCLGEKCLKSLKKNRHSTSGVPSNLKEQITPWYEVPYHSYELEQMIHRSLEKSTLEKYENPLGKVNYLEKKVGSFPKRTTNEVVQIQSAQVIQKHSSLISTKTTDIARNRESSLKHQLTPSDPSNEIKKIIAPASQRTSNYGLNREPCPLNNSRSPFDRSSLSMPPPSHQMKRVSHVKNQLPRPLSEKKELLQGPLNTSSCNSKMDNNKGPGNFPSLTRSVSSHQLKSVSKSTLQRGPNLNTLNRSLSSNQLKSSNIPPAVKRTSNNHLERELAPKPQSLKRSSSSHQLNRHSSSSIPLQSTFKQQANHDPAIQPQPLNRANSFHQFKNTSNSISKSGTLPSQAKHPASSFSKPSVLAPITRPNVKENINFNQESKIEAPVNPYVVSKRASYPFPSSIPKKMIPFMESHNTIRPSGKNKYKPLSSSFVPSQKSQKTPEVLAKILPPIKNEEIKLMKPKYFFTIQIPSNKSSSRVPLKERSNEQNAIVFSRVETLSDSEDEMIEYEEVIVPRIEPLPEMITELPQSPKHEPSLSDSSDDDSSSSCSSSCSCSSCSSSDSSSSSDSD